MGKKRTAVRDLFVNSVVDGSAVLSCKFRCGNPNIGATSGPLRMAKHILDCPAAPAEAKDIAMEYMIQHPPSSSEGGGSEAPPKKMCRIDEYYAPTSVDLHGDLNSSFCDFIVENNISFRAADSRTWKKLSKMMRPTYRPACARTLRTTILKTRAEEAFNNTIQAVRKAELVSVSIDGWTNIRRERILNVVVLTPQPYLWSTEPIGSETCGADKIAKVVIEAIRDIEDRTGAKVVALVTDNAADMKAAWRKLKEQRPLLTCLGCFAHGMNLFIGDVAKIPECKAVFDAFVAVVNYVHCSPKRMARLTELQCQEYGRTVSLDTPADTRWYTLLKAVVSVLRSRRALRRLALELEDPALSAHVLSSEFWSSGRDLADVLTPAGLFILEVESDRSTLDDAFQAFADVAWALDGSNHPKKTEIVDLLRHRFRFLYQRVLVLAHALNPARRPTQHETDICQQFLRESFSSVPEKLKQVLLEFSWYSARAGCFGKEDLWANLPERPIDWWRERGALTGANLLVSLAIGIFTIPSSSAATERSFKAMSLVHTKLRNRLHSHRVRNIVVLRGFLRGQAMHVRTGRTRRIFDSEEPKKHHSDPEEPLVEMEHGSASRANEESDSEEVEEYDDDVDEEDEADAALQIVHAERSGDDSFYEETVDDVCIETPDIMSDLLSAGERRQAQEDATAETTAAEEPRKVSMWG